MNLFVTLRLLFVLLMVALAGCATPQRGPVPLEPQPPPLAVAENVWWQVESEICAEAQAATTPARSFAHGQMAHWRQLLMQRTEADFIPWFSSYWTQQWLTAKVAWYNLSAGEGSDPPVDRLAAYLQAQYHERVLAPVAAEIDPSTVVAQTTKLYIQRFGQQLQPIARRHGVPPEQFEQRLKGIPAIALAPPPGHDASLFQLVQADPLERLPAYAALLREARDVGGIAEAGLSKNRISPVARRVSEKLLDKLAISGGASAASTLVGGVAGTVISIGAAGIGVLIHEAGRKDIESQLRETLSASTDDMWHILVEDRGTGVMAGVYHLAAEVGKVCPQIFTQPAAPGPLLQEIPLPEQPPRPEGSIDGDEPGADEKAGN